MRGNKGQTYEGGIKVPGFVTGALVPESLRGTSNTDLFHISDWLPTLTAVAEIDPSELPEQLDGVDQYKALFEVTPTSRTSVVHNFDYLGTGISPPVAVRVGDLKFLSNWDDVNLRPTMPRYVYNISADPREEENMVDLTPRPDEIQDFIDTATEMVKGLYDQSVPAYTQDYPYQGVHYCCMDCSAGSPTPPGTQDSGDKSWRPWIGGDNGEALPNLCSIGNVPMNRPPSSSPTDNLRRSRSFKK